MNGYNLKNIRHEINAWKIKKICELFEQALNDVQRSQDSSVSIAMGYVLDGPGLIPISARFFSSPQ
jgi:hypothetical protein